MLSPWCAVAVQQGASILLQPVDSQRDGAPYIDMPGGIS
jgi:hypothetical protein